MQRFLLRNRYHELLFRSARTCNTYNELLDRLQRKLNMSGYHVCINIPTTPTTCHNIIMSEIELDVRVKEMSITKQVTCLQKRRAGK